MWNYSNCWNNGKRHYWTNGIRGYNEMSFSKLPELLASLIKFADFRNIFGAKEWSNWAKILDLGAMQSTVDRVCVENFAAKWVLACRNRLRYSPERALQNLLFAHLLIPKWRNTNIISRVRICRSENHICAVSTEFLVGLHPHPAAEVFVGRAYWTAFNQLIGPRNEGVKK